MLHSYVTSDLMIQKAALMVHTEQRHYEMTANHDTTPRPATHATPEGQQGREGGSNGKNLHSTRRKKVKKGEKDQTTFGQPPPFVRFFEARRGSQLEPL
jgi:hypothetical protein